MILNYFPPLFWAIVTTLIITPISIRVAVHFQLIDHPNSLPHKVHQRPIPKAGGLAIALSLFSLNLFWGNMASTVIRAILSASLLIFIFGLWDDAKSLPPRWKLMGQILGTIILISQGIYIRMLGNMIVLNIALTFIWVIGIT